MAVDRLRACTSPPRIGVWLFKWLLFRLVMGSGAVKLASGDPLWSGLTALAVHYETQPLPTPLAWYAHQLPGWFHSGSTAAVLLVELLAPPLFLAPRRWRLASAALVVLLFTGMGLTGNYAFFGLLTISLCVFLLDDAALARPLRRDRAAHAGFAGHTADHARRAATRGGQVQAVALWTVAAVTVPLSVAATARVLDIRAQAPWPVGVVADRVAPFRLVNGYGAFGVMSTTRPEIIVEASADGRSWEPYEFRFKPGDPRRPLRWVAPHQPRLDWEMWFAAQGDYRGERWFEPFLRRLLEGSPDVLDLIARAPLEGRPPRFVRAVLYRYRFTGAAARRAEGTWWQRERIGVYAPVLSNDQLTR